MKRLIYSLLAVCLFSSIALADKVESKKEYHESFNSVDKVSMYLNNKYGDFIIANWDKDIIDIKCEIIVTAKKKEIADEILSEIESLIGRDKDSVYAVTKFVDNFKTRKKVEIDIKYTIKAPAYLNYNINNKYGNIAISKITGKTSINLKYGNMLAKNLEFSSSSPLNQINLGYSNATINKCNYAKINIKYGKLKVEQAKALKVDAKYSDATLGQLETLHFYGKYGGLAIDSVAIVDIKAKYMNVEMKYLSSKLETDIKYGNLEVGNIEPDFSLIDVDAAYGNVELLIHQDAVYELEADVDFGSLDIPKKSNVNKNIGNTSEEVSGVVGPKGQTITGKVIIKMDYGNVEL